MLTQKRYQYYKSLLVDSLRFTYKSKSFWILGIFASLVSNAEGLFSALQYFLLLPPFSFFLVLKQEYPEGIEQYFSNFQSFSSALTPLLFLFILFIVSFCAQGILFGQLAKNQKLTFKYIAKTILPKYAGINILTIALHLLFIGIASYALLMTPLNGNLFSLHTLGLLIAFLILILFVVGLSFFTVFWLVFAASEGFIPAMKNALEMLGNYKQESLLFFTIMLFVKILFFAVLAVGTAAITLPYTITFLLSLFLENEFLLTLLTQIGFIGVIGLTAIFIGFWTVFEYKVWTDFVYDRIEK